MGRFLSRAVPAVATVVVLESSRQALSHEVTAAEERSFRTVNDLPDELHPAVWTVMQAGSLAAVLVVAAHAWGRGNPDRAVSTFIAGTAVWGGAKALKPVVGRGRPQQHLADVTVRGQTPTGLGYPSGHSAVAMTLALAATGGARPVVRAAAATVAAATGLGRMYVGAHLPYDVIGGFGIGILCGGAAGKLTSSSGAGGRPGSITPGETRPG